MVVELVNNLWVLICGLLTFTMTIAVGFLEIGELGESLQFSLLKTVLITGAALLVMAFIGFNIAFAPTIGGVFGNPFYGPGFFLGGFTSSGILPASNVWWSTGPAYSGAGLVTGTFFLYETATAAVTFALVGVIFLRKVKLSAIALFAIVYFAVIWTLPAAWIWNPGGWLAKLGMVDFAGGALVHGAAGAAGIGILIQVWHEERARGLPASPKQEMRVAPAWLALGILLLWVGWFGFNAGAVLAFNDSAIMVVITTFLAGAAGLASLVATAYLAEDAMPDLAWAGNGVLMGLIVITPIAGFVSPGSALLLGAVSGPLFYYANRFFSRANWFTDPVGLFPGHLVGGLFGVTMIGFFAQSDYASAAGYPNLPNGLFFGGGLSAVHQLGVEVLGIVAVVSVTIVLSFLTMRTIALALGRITSDTKIGTAELDEPGIAPAPHPVSRIPAFGK
jgi:Amt family ammonium transporter